MKHTSLKKREILEVNIDDLHPYERNARAHSRKQTKQLARSIERWGFTNAVLINRENVIVAGHGRVAAAKLLGMTSLPCVRVDFMPQAEQRAYNIADNKLALNAGWDDQLLALEIQELMSFDPGFDVSDTGFSSVEIDSLIEDVAPAEEGDPAEDAIADLSDVQPRCKPGDVWQLGPHILICGNSLDREVVKALMNDDRATMIFTDPPYNVAIERNVSGLGKTKHKNFAMACGEMNAVEYTAFLATAFKNLIAFSADGSIHFVCIDWRHIREVQDAAAGRYSELKNTIVWVKEVGGMGTFYRSRHELILAYKNGKAEHINTFELGQHGRHRTNVWEYRGPRSQNGEGVNELSLHPTCKPVQMIADALKDVSKRGNIVLDLFGGAGSTLIAAHKTGRRARLCEIDSRYCDRILHRWEQYAKGDAVLIACGIGGNDTTPRSFDANAE